MATPGRLKRAITLTIVAIPALFTALGAWFYEPVPLGTSADFWHSLCGVRLDRFMENRRTIFAGVYPRTEGWLIYWEQGHHSRSLYRLTPALAAADLAEAIEKLDPRDALYIGSPTVDACRAWLAASASDSAAPERRVLAVTEARISAIVDADTSADKRTLRRFDDFREQWRRGQHVWRNFVFEALFLTAWMAWLAWPVLRGATPKRWALHWGLAPLLLAVPFYLGYAPYAFTFGPTGGFFYSSMLVLVMLPVFLLPCTPLDIAILTALPRPLVELSQLSGPAMAMTSITCLGPVSLVAYGLLGGGAIYLLRLIIARRRLARRR
jgi:hypothetical protein